MTETLKVSEIFYSLQGEGLYTGTPSIFVRMFGCNFRCAGYSMPKGQLSQERLNINPDNFAAYKDLPLVHTGCDSYPSWDKRFAHLSPVLTISEVVDRIQALLPNGKFDGKIHLILTGGEPLLKRWQKVYISLFQEIKSRQMGLYHLTFETNGTQRIENDLVSFLWQELAGSYYPGIATTFSISSKMSSSGETWQDAIKPEIVNEYISVGRDTSYFKWVISSEDDIMDILEAKSAYAEKNINIPIYLMPAGGTTMHYDQNKLWVAELCKKHGFRYSQRLQVDLYSNKWST